MKIYVYPMYVGGVPETCEVEIVCDTEDDHAGADFMTGVVHEIDNEGASALIITLEPINTDQTFKLEIDAIKECREDHAFIDKMFKSEDKPE